LKKKKKKLVWNPTEIHALFDSIAKNIHQGMSVMPVCDIIRQTLDIVIQVLVQKTISVISSDFGLERLLEMAANPEQERVFESLVYEVLQTLEIPKPRKLIAGYQADTLNVMHKFKVLINMPFGSWIYKNLVGMWRLVSRETVEESAEV